MKNIHLLLLLSFTTNAYCQDISYIKTLDTIFVNFKQSQSPTNFDPLELE